MGHARALVNVKNQDTQINIFRDALNNGFTVREIEQIVKDFEIAHTLKHLEIEAKRYQALSIKN